MTLVFAGANASPNYVCLSTDITEDNQVVGAFRQGSTLYTYDDQKWYVIEPDLTLSEFVLPVTFSGTISIGAVSTGTSAAVVDGIGNYGTVLTAPGDVNSAPLISLPLMFNGDTWDRLRGDSAKGLLVQGETKDAGLGISVTRTLISSDDCSSTPADITSAPGANVKATAMDIIISVDTDCEVHILTEGGSDVCGAFLSAKVPTQLTPRGYIKGATNNKKLQITTSVAAKVRGVCNWFAEA